MRHSSTTMLHHHRSTTTTSLHLIILSLLTSLVFLLVPPPSSSSLSPSSSPSSLPLFVHAINIRFDMRYVLNATLDHSDIVIPPSLQHTSDDTYFSRSCFDNTAYYVRGEGNSGGSGGGGGGDNSQVTCTVTNDPSITTIPLTDCIGKCEQWDRVTQTLVDTLRTRIDKLRRQLEALLPFRDASRERVWPGVTTSITTVCDSTMGYIVSPIPTEYMDARGDDDDDSSYDTVIFVTMRPQEQYVKGHGHYCLLDDRASPLGTGRPIMGLLNIAPQQLRTNRDSTLEAMLLHESLHILGFHVDLFQPPSSSPPYTSTVSLHRSTGAYGEILYHVKSPATTQAMQQYYACEELSTTRASSWYGAPLENKIAYMDPIHDHMHTRQIIDSSTGAVISDQDIPAYERAYTLWEKTVFGNELMTGTFDPSKNIPHTPYLSVVTLALMHDLGYYDIPAYNGSIREMEQLIAREPSLGTYLDAYVKSPSQLYGYRMGCTFLFDRCEKWNVMSSSSSSSSSQQWDRSLAHGSFKDDTSARSRGLFCDQVQQVTDASSHKHCSYDLSGKASCGPSSIASYSTALPARYRHISGYDNMGSMDVWRDYCPIPQSISNGDCTITSNQVSENRKMYGEQYGAFSKCFLSTVNRDIISLNSPFARCYTTACGAINITASDGVTSQLVTHLFIKIGDSIWRKCPLQGGMVSDFDRLTGQVMCPPVHLLCPSGFVSQNFEEQIVRDSYARTRKATPIDNISIPFWAWIILGVGLAAIVGGFILLGIVLLVKHFRKKAKWNEKNTVDLRSKPIELH